MKNLLFLAFLLSLGLVASAQDSNEVEVDADFEDDPGLKDLHIDNQLDEK